jgi:hypothetical protein
MTILFFSTSPSSPFLDVLSDKPAPPATQRTPPVAYDTNIPDRGAFNLNGGHIFDPVLVGYREMQRVWRETLDADKNSSDSAVASGSGSGSGSVSSGSDSSAGSASEAGTSDPPIPNVDAAGTPSQQLLSPPAGYLDLPLIGLVLDLGWHRTDEGLRWEAENMRKAAEAKRARRAKRRRAEPTQGQGQQAQTQNETPQTQPAHPVVPGKLDSNPWLRSSFVGLW